MANGVVWKRRVDHLRKTVDSPQKQEVTVPEIIDEFPIASSLQSYQDPPAIHLNEGGTVVSPSNHSVPVVTERIRDCYSAS